MICFFHGLPCTFSGTMLSQFIQYKSYDSMKTGGSVSLKKLGYKKKKRKNAGAFIKTGWCMELKDTDDS